LEIEIFDSFTGKNRPPSTLSGGETFIASISLALALTDVVQSRSGGISIDSLFIDEGFGSLDPESLELALGIIDEIRSERVVGLISHVGDLGSRINSQIIVHKSNKGSSLSLIGV
jgi:exonuclease SbcC